MKEKMKEEYGIVGENSKCTLLNILYIREKNGLTAKRKTRLIE